MFNIKRILTLTLPILALSLCTPVSVSAVQEYNSWNQTTHSKTDSCSVCGGNDKISVSCPKTASKSCPTSQQCESCGGDGSFPSDCFICGGGQGGCGILGHGSSGGVLVEVVVVQAGVLVAIVGVQVLKQSPVQLAKAEALSQ